MIMSCTTVKSSDLCISDEFDDTEYIQTLLNSDKKEIIIPAQQRPWVVLPLVFKNKENKTLIFEAGCIIRAKRGYFKDVNDVLFTVENCKNITIKGYGAVLKMNKEDYWSSTYTKSQWRDGVAIYNTSDLIIEGLKVQSTGGDGIYIGQSGGIETVCKNITLKHLVLEDNHRQGISIISVDGLLMEGCSVFGTNGTLPKAGIDFEPNDGDYGFTNVLIKNCTFRYNKGSGIHIFLKTLTKDSVPVDITIEHCVLAYNGCGLSIMAIPKGVKGTVNIINTTIKGMQYIRTPKSFTVFYK